MLERLSARSLAAVVHAQEAARELRHESVHAPHLLLGALSVIDSSGCDALNRAGLRYDRVRSRLEWSYRQRPDAPSGRIALAADARLLLKLALWEAQSDGGAPISNSPGQRSQAPGDGRVLVRTRHLALACAREDAPPSLQRFVDGRGLAICAALGVERPHPGGAASRTLAARSAALRLANEIRSQRARIKRELKRGEVSIEELLQSPPLFIRTAKLFDILLAVPTFGRVKTNKILSEARISPSTTIQSLSEEQRRSLLRLLSR